jgi:hypothetical protein
VSRLTRPDQKSHLRQLVATLPRTKSGDAAVLARVADLRARFHGWLHQDEFGPRRGEQTAALRAHIKLVRKLCQQLKKGASRSRDRLDAALRNSNDRLSPVVAALGEAAADVEPALQVTGASKPNIGWFSQVRSCAGTLFVQFETLDDATDGEIGLTAVHRKFELAQTETSEEFGLLDAEYWLNGYWGVLVETLNRLNDQRGAQERVSLKLLVEELCQLWEQEAGKRVTAHGLAKGVYASRVETDAGRFVTAAVEAMLPEKAWFDQHAEFARSVRAETFLPDEKGDRRQRDRARQILVIMKDFVARRSKPGKVR